MAARRTVSRSTSSPVLVKVARVGGAVTEWALNGEHTVEAALEVAGITVGSGMRVRVNGAVKELGSKLKNGDVVTVAEKVQGGK